MNSVNNESSQWNISTDIYDIVGMLDNLKATYVDTADETTLSLGIFGFLSDTEAKKIQTTTIMSGELGNEMFPNRAKLDKNVVTHAMYCNITNLNAVPAQMTIDFAIKESDLNQYMKNDTFVFDRTCPIYVGEMEFHFDYDIVLTKQKQTATGKYLYNARYDIDPQDPNDLSNIISPYLDQPYTANFNNYTYIFLRAIIRQVSLGVVEDKIVGNSIIDNKSYTFTFSDQMAAFNVYVSEAISGGYSKPKLLKPLLYGSPIELDTNEYSYCWYLYMNDTNIRVEFDISSYLPGIGAQIRIEYQTTKGNEGNFSYVVTGDEEANGFYFDIESENYAYKKITCYANPVTDSQNGTNKKSIDELKTLIPKMGLSRGYITTETDLNNYFNLINTDDNRMILQKKIDNQLNREWYDYLLMKDENTGNVVPTNSIFLRISDYKNNTFLKKANISGETNLYMLPGGTVIKYSVKQVIIEGDLKWEWVGEPINEDEMPALYSYNDDGTGYYGWMYVPGLAKNCNVYYYRTLYDMIINESILYCSYYLTATDTYSYFRNVYINEEMFMGFIVNTNHIERQIIDFGTDEEVEPVYIIDPDDIDPTTQKPKKKEANPKNIYRFTFTTRQSVSEDVGLYDFVDDINNMLVFMVIDRESKPYRYFVGRLINASSTMYDFTWEFDFVTDDKVDDQYRLNIVNGYEISHEWRESSGSTNPDIWATSPGQFEDNASARIYIMGKILDEDGNPVVIGGRKAPLSDEKTVDEMFVSVGQYTLINIYSITGGVDFYNNFTQIMNTRTNIYQNDDLEVQNVPVVGAHYFRSESDISYFIHELSRKKVYIDHCLSLVENNMDIDFKYFNTYGESKTYLASTEEKSPLGNIDITMEFRVKLMTNSNEVYVKQAIIKFVKEYIENLNETFEDFHVSSLIHDIMEEMHNDIVYIEFRRFNKNELGVDHIELMRSDSIYTVPEFICIRNRINTDGDLEPWIEITVMSK